MLLGLFRDRLSVDAQILGAQRMYTGYTNKKKQLQNYSDAVMASFANRRDCLQCLWTLHQSKESATASQFEA